MDDYINKLVDENRLSEGKFIHLYSKKRITTNQIVSPPANSLILVTLFDIFRISIIPAKIKS